jgi:hypothetical protein
MRRAADSCIKSTFGGLTAWSLTRAVTWLLLVSILEETRRSGSMEAPVSAEMAGLAPSGQSSTKLWESTKAKSS